MPQDKIKLKPVVPGDVEGEIVKVEALSFYGEVNPKDGRLVDGRSIDKRILVIGRSRGSTVGSYIVYGLRFYGKAPKAIVMIKSEPIVVVGAVLAGIPLFEGLERELFEKLRDGCYISISKNGYINFIKC